MGLANLRTLCASVRAQCLGGEFISETGNHRGTEIHTPDEQIKSTSNNAGRIAGNRRASCHVPGHHCAGADNGPFTDRHAAKDGRAAADAGAPLHNGGHWFPIIIGLQAAFRGGRARHFIVDESHPVANEDFVFDLHGFADEGVAGDLAVTADARVFLNLDKRTHLRAVADFAAVEIDEVMDDDIASQLDVGRDHTELSGHKLHAKGDAETFGVA